MKGKYLSSKKTVEINNLEDAHIRPIVTRGVGKPGLDPERAVAPTIIIIAYPFPPQLGTEPVKLITTSIMKRPSNTKDSKINCTDYLHNVLAKIQANYAGVDEALMLDHRGFIAEHAEEVGADAVSSITPIYYNYDRAAYKEYFGVLSQSTNLPILIYNNPGITGYKMPPKTVKGIVSENETVIGIKDSSRDIAQVAEMVGLDIDNCKLNVLIGGGWLLLPGLAVGADGCISGLSNLVPDIVVKIYEEYRNKNLPECQLLTQKLIQFKSTLSKYPRISSYKFFLKKKGHNFEDNVIKPLRKLKIEEKKRLLEKVDALKF